VNLKNFINGFGDLLENWNHFKKWLTIAAFMQIENFLSIRVNT
jgi:hypothetical protein